MNDTLLSIAIEWRVIKVQWIVDFIFSFKELTMKTLKFAYSLTH